jgi:hypothetical protein
MVGNQHLLDQLQQMLNWKKSKKFYAEKLGVTEVEVDELIKELKKNSESIRNEAEASEYISALEETIVRFEEDFIKGTGEIIMNSPEEIRSLEELIVKCKIDTDVWEISKYVQNYWGNGDNPRWQVKAWLNKKSDKEVFQSSFIEFLDSYSPVSQDIMSPKMYPGKNQAALVINKQDAHYNKLDVNGENNIYERFARMAYRVETILSQAALSNNLDKVIYIIGSDEFNSEFTGMTTKGTPQQNIGSYHASFQAVCDHEVLMITLLLQYAKNVDIVYVAGNHDEYVGWHLINWLQTYFRNTDRLTFDCSSKYRKYISYGISAMMFNHGDAIKPAKLAAMFPMEYKNEWSNHETYYIFTGDKHHEVSLDFNGIKFYQIPAFSNAKSGWDEKNGYTCARGEVTGFLIDIQDGMTNIFKQYL